jgi:hypothetical protein
MPYEERILIDGTCRDGKHDECTALAWDAEEELFVPCRCECHRAVSLNGMPLPSGYFLGGRVHQEPPLPREPREGDVVAVYADGIGIIWDDERPAGDAEWYDGLVWYPWPKLDEYSIRSVR